MLVRTQAHKKLIKIQRNEEVEFFVTQDTISGIFD